MLPPPLSQTVRVLLIEDEPHEAARFREMLADCGGRWKLVAETARLEAGLEIMMAGGADIVLLDLTLPDCEGLDCFIRAHHAAPDVPILVFSSGPGDTAAAKSLELGAKDHLEKRRCDAYLLQRALRYAVERSRSEAQLAHEGELLNTLLDNIPDRIYFKDAESRFIRINSALKEFFHLQQASDAYGKTDADFFGPEHALETRADELQLMETGEPILGKIEVKTPTGGGRSWSLTTKLPLRDQQGRVIGTCGISREITAIKEMEEQLATERNLLRSVIDNLPDSIFLKDAEGRYLLDNTAHYQVLGASDSSEVIGRSVFDFFPDAIAEHFHASDMTVMRTGQPVVNREESLPDFRGRPRWLLTSKLPWHGEDGSVRGVLCISRDITEQKEAAEKLRIAYAELAHSREEVLGAMGKLQAAHQELRGVQLQLVEAEKMKSIGRLAAGVAHEVKNPLAVIIMGIEFLSQQAAGDDAMNMVLKEMHDAVQRADGVIRGLLDFSAPKQIDVQPQDLNALIEQALKMVRGEMKGSFKVVRDLQPRLPHLAIDSAKISQVFINVFTNAIHAMGDHGTLSVRTHAKQLTSVGSNVGSTRSESFRVGATMVVVEIDDTGHGIPEEKLAKLWEPFFTTKPTGKGTGLGLSVVKTIMDLHGATIDIRNLPEGGARVTMMFQV